MYLTFLSMSLSIIFQSFYVFFLFHWTFLLSLSFFSIFSKFYQFLFPLLVTKTNKTHHNPPYLSILFFVLFFPLWLVVTNAIKTHYNPCLFHLLFLSERLQPSWDMPIKFHFYPSLLFNIFLLCRHEP